MKRSVWIVITVLLLAASLLLQTVGTKTPHRRQFGSAAQTAGDTAKTQKDPSPAEAGEGSSSGAPDTPDLRNDLPCTYYNAAIAKAHLAAAKGEVQDIAGAIVPHYAPAMYMAANALASVDMTPDTVVVAAPNHAGHGDLIQICGRGYYWDGGSIRGDADFAASLCAGLGIQPDDSAAREDWSASLHMPYIAHFFPDARVVTVLLSRGAEEGQLRTLARLLSEAAESRSLLVLGSADFSHYQEASAAHACDKETAQVIADGDITRLLSLGNDHVDSPETVAVLLLYGEALDRTPEQADGRFELYAENGRQLAGSYYEYLLR